MCIYQIFFINNKLSSIGFRFLLCVSFSFNLPSIFFPKLLKAHFKRCVGALFVAFFASMSKSCFRNCSPTRLWFLSEKRLGKTNLQIKRCLKLNWATDYFMKIGSVNLAIQLQMNLPWIHQFFAQFDFLKVLSTSTSRPSYLFRLCFCKLASLASLLHDVLCYFWILVADTYSKLVENKKNSKLSKSGFRATLMVQKLKVALNPP